MKTGQSAKATYRLRDLWPGARFRDLDTGQVLIYGEWSESDQRISCQHEGRPDRHARLHPDRPIKPLAARREPRPEADPLFGARAFSLLAYFVSVTAWIGAAVWSWRGSLPGVLLFGAVAVLATTWTSERWFRGLCFALVVAAVFALGALGMAP